MRSGRASASAAPFDVFPLFGVLLCLLGCLTMILLVIIVLSLGAGKTLAVYPEEVGRMAGKLPHFVIWDGQYVTVLPANDPIEWRIASASEGVNDSAFGELLQRIAANREKEYMIIAIRPSGFLNSHVIRDLVFSKGIDIGYEPIDQNAQIKTIQVSHAK